MSEDYTNINIEDLAKEMPNKARADEKKRFVEERLWEKLERVGKKISFTKDIVALFRYMLDNKIQWYRKTIVIGALIYFLTPIDAVPDIAPLVGYLDDLGVIMAVLKYLGSELIPYYDN